MFAQLDSPLGGGTTDSKVPELTFIGSGILTSTLLATTIVLLASLMINMTPKILCLHMTQATETMKRNNALSKVMDKIEIQTTPLC